MQQEKTIIFESRDKSFYFRQIQHLILLIGFYLLVSDLIPIYGLLFSTFLMIGLLFLAFYLYKRYRWHAVFIPYFNWFIIPPFVISCIMGFLYFMSKVDYFIILAHQAQFLQPVVAFPLSEKLGYLLGFFIFQGLPSLILLAIIAQRQKIVWKVDAEQKQLILIFVQPMYKEERIISLENINMITFGATDPFTHLFTNTAKVSISYLNKKSISSPIMLSKTPIPLFIDKIFRVFKTMNQDSQIDIQLFLEMGDHIRPLIFTREIITDKITYPFKRKIPLSKEQKLITNNQKNDESIQQPVLIASQMGAIYRKSVGSILLLLFGFICVITALLLGSLLPRFINESVMVPELNVDHGFNAEILLVSGLFLIILVFGLRLIIISWFRLVGHTRLVWTIEGIKIGVKWTKFSKNDYFIPYRIINDVYPLLESFDSGLSLLWLEIPFIRFPIWRGVQDDHDHRTIIKYSIRKYFGWNDKSHLNIEKKEEEKLIE